jgi:hypothetical protein
LAAKDIATVNGVTMEVLSVQQRLTEQEDTTVLGRFQDTTPALIRGSAGRGTVYCVGFLPALDYIKKAETARRTREQQREADEPPTEHPAPPVILTAEDVTALEPKNRLERSRNPWEFPEAVREILLTPVRTAGVDPPLSCSVPLIDAVLLHCDRGMVIPLANYTLEPVANIDLSVRIEHPIDRIETVHLGRIDFEHEGNDRIRFSMPLEASDYVKIYYR